MTTIPDLPAYMTGDDTAMPPIAEDTIFGPDDFTVPPGEITTILARLDRIERRLDWLEKATGQSGRVP